MVTWPQTNPRRKVLKRDFARFLRSTPSDAETKLWVLLRSKRMLQLRFRRQQPIGPYIVDFYCSAAKLIVESDGSQHFEAPALAYDAARTKWLEARGYRVLRVGSFDVLNAPDRVLEVIWLAVKEKGIPLPEPADAGSTLPQGEG